MTEQTADAVHAVAKEPITRRTYLVMRTIMHGSGIGLAIEAVASTAIEHPEWDMDEKRTWEDWDA